MGYSLLAKFISEVVGMTWVIYIGEACLANELLPNTKGHEMGWLSVAFGFGMQFFPPIAFLGMISTTLNPAFAFQLFIVGNISFVECLVLSAGSYLGAFIGAVLHWLHYLPHYKTVPEPALPNEAYDSLIDRRDVYGPSSLRFASHVSKRKTDNDTGNLNAIKRLKYYTSNKLLINDYYSQNNLQAKDTNEVPLQRRSVQVGDLHEYLTKKYVQNKIRQEKIDDIEEDNPVQHKYTLELYDAAVRADQVAKLSIFATRPAIYAPLFNFVCETMGTVALLFSVQLFLMQKDMLPSPVDVIYIRCIFPLIVGFLVAILVIGLGGPTGYAANPARDLSPRLAHFLLPIVGKGSSEWKYSWIPVMGPYVGSVIASGMVIAMKYLYNSGGVEYFIVPR